MPKTPLVSLIALAALFPNAALACMPANPYFYLVKGAYLLVSLGVVLAIVFELFRYAVETVRARQILRRGALVALLFAIVMLLVACAYSALETSWETDYGTVPAGASGQRC